MSDNDSLREKLNSQHEFPGPFVFKIIGPNDEKFSARLLQAVLLSLGPTATPDVQSRTSSGGKHISLTVTVEARDADHVLEIYAAIGRVDDVKFVL